MLEVGNNTYYKKLPTVFFIFFIAGYDLITSIFAFAMEEGRTQIITIPFRALELFLALIVLIKFRKWKYIINAEVKLLWLFWILLLIRFLWDVFVMHKDAAVTSNWRMETFLFMVPLTMIPMYAFQKTSYCIDFEKSFFWVYLIDALAIFFAFINNAGMRTVAEERLQGNISMGSLETGYLGAKTLFLSILLLRKYSLNKWLKIGVAVVVVSSCIVLLRAGSRGPILASLVVGIVLIYSFAKQKLLGIILLVIAVLLFMAFEDKIIEGVRSISPILVNRFEHKTEIGGQLNDREAQYLWAWNQFLKNPLTGGSFALFTTEFSYTGVGYTHNAFIETLMQLGLLGGLFFIILYSKAIIEATNVIRKGRPYAWVCVIMIVYMMKVMVSSAFYLTPVISISMMILFMQKNKYR